jgi:predicted nucleotidyltransferase
VRLSRNQSGEVLRIVRAEAGPDAEVRVFGSRLDEGRRGGDVDLLVNTSSRVDALAKARILHRLEETLVLPVDVVFAERGREPDPFQKMARRGARSLEAGS